MVYVTLQFSISQIFMMDQKFYSIFTPNNHDTSFHTDLKQHIHSKITMAGEVVPYYTVTALVPTLK